MNCTTATIKFVLFIFNVLCAIFGLVTVILCSLAVTSLHQEHLTFCIFGIVVGTVAFIVASFGCCGAHRESSVYMCVYATLLSILLVVQLAIVLTFHSKGFVHLATDEVERLWSLELKSPGPMAQIESQFQCCGLHNSTDYLNANLTIPTSCYEKEGEVPTLFVDGCWEKAASIYAYVGKIVRVTNWSLCSIEITALIFACILAHSFRAQSRMRYATNN